MRTKINTQKYIVMIVALLLFHANSYAQKSIVNDQWQERTREILPGLKQRWAEILGATNQIATRGLEVPTEDLLNATYGTQACFILDYDSYLTLTEESNLDFLIKLDTTRVYYYILNAKADKVVSHSAGRFIDGQWRNNGFGGVMESNNSDNLIRLYAKNIPAYILQVEYYPGSERGYHIFYENGQLMCFRPDISAPQPLLETLIEYRNKSLSNPRRR